MGLKQLTFLKDQKRHYVISLPEDIKTDQPSEKLDNFEKKITNENNYYEH